jgi:hypothetical protein
VVEIDPAAGTALEVKWEEVVAAAVEGAKLIKLVRNLFTVVDIYLNLMFNIQIIQKGNLIAFFTHIKF